MARSVVLQGGVRCPRCQLPPRWCVCAGLRPVPCPLKVDVLMHFMEAFRPSSTGHLIQRVLPSADVHSFRPERLVERDAVVQPGKVAWILHPGGEPLPANEIASVGQAILLDGTWVQATGMMRHVEGWGRKVSLPMTGTSRYWLRTQAGPGRFSTVEALLFLLAALGMHEAHAGLNLQFELHVYATLLARGKKRDAAAYLETSPVREALPELVRELGPQAD